MSDKELRVQRALVALFNDVFLKMVFLELEINSE